MSTNPLNEPVLDLVAVKEGDRVGIRSARHDRYHGGTVARLTATQIVVAEDSGSGAPSRRKFRRTDGGEVGVGYGAQLIHPDAPDLLAYAARRLFDEVYFYAEADHREIRTSKDGASLPEIAKRLTTLADKITKAQAKLARLAERMPKPAKTAEPETPESVRLVCTDCTRETSNPAYRNRWCRDLPESNERCPGFLLAVAVPDGQ